MEQESLEIKIGRLVRLMRQEGMALAEDLAERRLKGGEAAKHVAEVLRSRWPTADLWLVGSMAGDGTGLSLVSDIDILARGIPPAEHVDAQAAAEREAAGFAVDLVLYEDLSEAGRDLMLREAIRLLLPVIC